MDNTATSLAEMKLSECIGLQKHIVLFQANSEINLAIFILLILIALYFAWIRYAGVVKYSKAALYAQIDLLDEKIKSLRAPSSELQYIESKLNKIKKEFDKTSLWKRYFITSQKLLEGWRKLHGIEPLLEDFQTEENDESYKAFLYYRLKELSELFKEMESREALTLAKLIDETLPADAQIDQSDLIKMRQLYKESLRVYYKERDSYYEKLIDWYNKVTLLVFMAIVFALLIDLFEANAFILLGGGIGGLLSKLRSVIKGIESSQKYIFNWITLFLTPIVGILTGWGGFYLFAGIFIPLANPNLFHTINWCSFPLLISISIIFGYSAGLFEKMIGEIEIHFQKYKSKIATSK